MAEVPGGVAAGRLVAVDKTRLAQRALTLAWVVLGGVAVLYFALHAIRAVRFPFPLDYAEGPLVEQARVLASGNGIYRANVSDYPFTVANYPPLFPALLSALGSVFGFGFGVGRAVTTGFAVGCAILAYRIVRVANQDRLAALAAGLFFVASPYVVFWSSLVRIDFMALAFSLSAILLVLSRPDGPRTPLVAALLVTLAVLTRQSHLLAAPLAIVGALGAKRTRSALVFVVALAALVGSSTILLQVWTTGGFLFHTVEANVNRYSWSLLGYFARDLLAESGALLGLAAAAAILGLIEGAPGAKLLALYFVGATLSALTIGKVGSHVNYFLEITAAASIFAGLALARARRAGARWLALGISAVLLAQLGWLSARSLLRPDPIEEKLSLRPEFAALEQVLSNERGSVLADETMGMLVLTGHPILVQPFELTQLVRQGLWDQRRVVDDVRAGRFALVLVNDGPRTPSSWTRERWTPELLSAIHEAYEPNGALAEATLYRPRASR